MMTFRQFAVSALAVPASTSWYLADVGEARGRQELFTRQSPQRLKALREHALVESAVSSNRIEGVEVDAARVATIMFGQSHLRDRNEEEVRGYREALDLIHTKGAKLPISERTIRRLHSLSRGGVGDAGEYKTKDSDIIEVLPSGRRIVRFETVRAAKVPKYMGELIEAWRGCLVQRVVHPLIALGAFNLDFLCIHPFRDGNGRTSRLLLLLQCYHLGLEVGRYISLERHIEQSKERYYETLKQSSQRWHDGKHDPWPYINYLLYTLRGAYQEFERRVGQVAAPRGEKRAALLSAIERMEGPFRIAELQRQCPGVSVDMIRRVLKQLRDEGKVECFERGRNATWGKKRGI